MWDNFLLFFGLVREKQYDKMLWDTTEIVARATLGLVKKDLEISELKLKIKALETSGDVEELKYDTAVNPESDAGSRSKKKNSTNGTKRSL